MKERPILFSAPMVRANLTDKNPFVWAVEFKQVEP